MINLSVDQALQDGVLAHQAGRTEEAERYYSAILAAEPTHPDSNHNLAILLTDQGLQENARHHYIQAIAADLTNERYWLSFVESLLKGGKLDDAATAIEQAYLEGVHGSALDSLEHYLRAEGYFVSKNGNRKGVKNLVTAETENLMQTASESMKTGDILKAKSTYKQILLLDPTNQKAIVSLNNLNSDLSKMRNPPSGNLELIFELFKKEKFSETLSAARIILENFPEMDRAANVFNLRGVAYFRLGQYELAINEYANALEIQPTYADALNNMGCSLNKIKKTEQALSFFDRAIAAKPNFSHAYNNAGNALQNIGKLHEAIARYEKALEISPLHPEALNNRASALLKLGKLRGAIEGFENTLLTSPFNTAAALNLHSLSIQLPDLPTLLRCPEKWHRWFVGEHIENEPKFLIKQAIMHFSSNDLKACESMIDALNNLEREKVETLPTKERRFLIAYKTFLNCLLLEKGESEPPDQLLIYHFGESHCLSFANQCISLYGTTRVVSPRLTLGAKAFHLGSDFENEYKSITEYNFANIPDGSFVFLSFGEIDCRIDEGLTIASEKTGVPVDHLTRKTVAHYLRWLENLNRKTGHKIFILNVPAPTWDSGYDKNTNRRRANVVSLFNQHLNEMLPTRHQIIDTYTPTKNNHGFSNNLYHIDSFHLGPRFLTEIEKQLN